MRDQDDGSKVMKAVLIGDGAVGKTSIRRNYLGDEFIEGHSVRPILDAKSLPHRLHLPQDFPLASIRLPLEELLPDLVPVLPTSMNPERLKSMHIPGEGDLEILDIQPRPLEEGPQLRRQQVVHFRDLPRYALQLVAMLNNCGHFVNMLQVLHDANYRD